jgi:hypothetical protein
MKGMKGNESTLQGNERNMKGRWKEHARNKGT